MNNTMKRNFEHFFNLDNLGYKSPIELIHGELQTKVENGIYEAVQKYNVNVDKNELIKALQYDRDQYNKGFTDGVKEFADKVIDLIYSADDINPINEWQIRDLVKEMVGETQ